MLFKLCFTLTAFAGIAHAGQLRAKNPADNEVEASTRGLETSGGLEYGDGEVSNLWHEKDYENYAFYLESKGWGDDYYLGAHDNKKAHIDPKQDKFVYYDFKLEKYGSSGKTGECFEMDEYFSVTLKACDDKKQQKWLISEAPAEYGHYYTVTNAYHGYVLNYSPTNTYYLDSRSWESYKYDDKDYVDKTLFYKGAFYTKNTNEACRTSSGGSGEGDGKDYVLYSGIGRDECSTYCDADRKCKGWEYSDRRCEIWYTRPAEYEYKSGLDCYVKQHL